MKGTGGCCNSESCSPNALGDLNVTLKDLSGTVPGTIHYKVLDVSSYEKDITVGAAMILVNVSVFTPKPSKHYLNITKEMCLDLTPREQRHYKTDRIREEENKDREPTPREQRLIRRDRVREEENKILAIRSRVESKLSNELLKATHSTIQMAAIPLVLQHRDVIGVAETGSGKAAAFIFRKPKMRIDMPSSANTSSATVLLQLIILSKHLQNSSFLCKLLMETSDAGMKEGRFPSSAMDVFTISKKSFSLKQPV
ncbi:transposase, MuDR, MULE transposase domain protein [Tanacetum coccineum]